MAATTRNTPNTSESHRISINPVGTLDRFTLDVEVGKASVMDLLGVDHPLSQLSGEEDVTLPFPPVEVLHRDGGRELLNEELVTWQLNDRDESVSTLVIYRLDMSDYPEKMLELFHYTFHQLQTIAYTKKHRSTKELLWRIAFETLLNDSLLRELVRKHVFDGHPLIDRRLELLFNNRVGISSIRNYRQSLTKKTNSRRKEDKQVETQKSTVSAAQIPPASTSSPIGEMEMDKVPEPVMTAPDIILLPAPPATKCLPAPAHVTDIADDVMTEDPDHKMHKNSEHCAQTYSDNKSMSVNAPVDHSEKSEDNLNITHHGNQSDTHSASQKAKYEDHASAPDPAKKDSNDVFANTVTDDIMPPRKHDDMTQKKSRQKKTLAPRMFHDVIRTSITISSD